jgi:uncharacterized membrane protein
MVLPELLVGVALAVALVPLVTLTGIGIAFASTKFFIGAWS